MSLIPMVLGGLISVASRSLIPVVLGIGLTVFMIHAEVKYYIERLEEDE